MEETSQRPRDAETWNKRYVDGELPWDSGKPDQHLGRVIETHRLEPGRALEIGCGTGTNAIWLAERGFVVTALDISPVAIARARAKAAAARISCHFLVGDFLRDPIPDAPYDFIYDRGCLHTLDSAGERSLFASRAANLLVPDGVWHSLVGSTDGPPRDTGPPRRSAVELVTAVEPHLEIIELRSTVFDSGLPGQARAWILVARRRAVYSG